MYSRSCGPFVHRRTFSVATPTSPTRAHSHRQAPERVRQSEPDGRRPGAMLWPAIHGPRTHGTSCSAASMLPFAWRPLTAADPDAVQPPVAVEGSPDGHGADSQLRG